MTVDITQEEMDILNLNGISKDTVRNNVQYMRATGMTDEQIRQDFTNTISTLRPVTKLSHNTTGKITEWENAGGITPYELAKKKAVVYTGSYNNIDENANLNWFEKKLKNSSYNDSVDNRIKTQEQKILERNQRVNNGTASFLDRAGAAIDRLGKASYQAQTERPVIEPVALKAGVDLNSGKVIDNRDKSKPIGFGEALADSFMTGSWLPYVGGYLSKADVQKQREIQKHILNGEPIRPDEKAYLDRKLEEIQERNVRGYTLGGKIAEGFLPSLIRFGGEMATGGAILEGLGLVNKAAEGANFGQKALTAGSNMLKTGAVNTVLPFGWNDTYENYQSRRFDKELDFTDEGHAIFREAEEKPATSFMKSVGQTFVMFSSEASGELLGLPLKGAAASAEKYIGNPLYKYLSQNKQLSKFVEKTIPALSKAYEKINHLPIKGKNIDWLKSRVKFDGLLEEMGEEVVEDVLNLTLGTGDEKRTLDNYINAIFKSPDEWAVIAGAVALQGMSLSAASHLIGSHMANNGATADEIKEVMENTSESDKKEIVENILQSGTVDLSDFYPEDKQRAEEIKDDIYNKLVNANVNTQEANDAAIMVSSFFERYGTKNDESREKFNEFINNLAIKYNIPVEERNSLVYNQPAENKFEPKFQAISSAGAENNEIELAQKEWKEKGTDSKYFKKWFGNSKVVDKNGKPLVVYHGSLEKNIDEFDITYARNEDAFFFTDNKNIATDYAKEYEETVDKISGKVYPVYLSMKKPYVVDAQGKTYSQYYSQLQNDFSGLAEQGYDGLIIKNIKDNKWNNTEPELSNVYAVLNSEQIKSLGNQGTFDANNPNIYYQTGIDKIDNSDKYKNLPEDLKNAIDYIYKGESVYNVTGEEFPNNGENLNERIDNFYKENFNNKIENNIGLIKLDKRSIKDSIYHGINTNKVNAFAAVPYVLQQGKFLDISKKNNKQEKRYLFVAPITINKNPYYCEVVVKSNKDRQGFYIHEVELIEKLADVFSTAQHGTSTSSKSIITDLVNKFNPDVNNHEDNVLFQKNIKPAYEYDYIHNDITGEKIDIVMNNDIKVDKIKPQKISDKLPFEISQKPADNKKAIISSLKLNNGNTIKTINKNINQYEIINKNTIEKSISNLYKHDVDYSDKIVILYNIKKLCENAHLILSHKDTKQNTQTIIKRFANIARVNSKDYLVEIICKDNGELSIYSINPINTKNDGNQKRLDKSQQLDTVNNSITYIKDLFKSKIVEKYNKDYKNSQSQSDVYFQPAYHGTPHKFDKFSTENIGTGEGAQAHGWGLYFAGNKDISEIYRKNLVNGYSAINTLKYKGKTINNETLQTVLYKLKSDSFEEALRYINNKIDYYGKRYKNAKEKYPNSAEYLKNEKSLLDKAINIKNSLNEIDINDIKLEQGQLFEVDIPEDDVLLDEEKPFSKQPEKVQKALKELAEEYTGLNDEFEYDQNGEAIYKYLSYHAGSPQDASMELNDVGIKGITYDGRTDGRCYVIFDDKAINILKTYYQENNSEDEKLIAGFRYQEVMDKLLSLYDEIGKLGNSQKEKAAAEKLLVKAQVLEDAFDYAEHPDKFANENKRHETMLNAYYIMNNQELPNDYVETESGSKRTYDDLKAIYDRKKEERETEYLGYFYKEANTKPIVTIMASHNSSTALHEFGHMFLELLNELAKVNTDAREQLEAVNKWLGSNGEYTSAQHEKFANNFVAYLYKGKAPNSKLKSVFEDFKKWLRTVYDHILDIPDVEISEEVQELFDNIFGSDSFYQERKEANELLKKVRKNSIKERLTNLENQYEIKQLDDVQKAHKEAAYQILSIATGKSIKYLKSIFETNSTKPGFEKKRENVFNLIDRVGDKFTALEGFQQEWIKFYNDTGVSYDNQDINGDYELAMQAFDTIINRAYRNPAKEYDDELSRRAEYFDRRIKNADREYKQLIQAYKNENRNVAMSAIYDWLNSLDNEIKEDYENKFIYDSGIIERDENIDKFAKAKRKILSKAMELENKLSINKNEQYQEMVKEIMKELDFLQPSDKAKLTANILDVPSTEFLMSSIDNIMDIAKTMEDMNLRRKLANEIHKELQQTKNIKKNGRTVGKYDYKSNKIFEELRMIDRLSAEAANDLRLNNEHFATAEDNGLFFGAKLINRFLSYKSAGKMFADTELVKSIYDDILKIKLAGKYAKSELELQEKLSEEKDIEELINIVQNKKDAKGVLKAYVNVVGNLESTLNALFNKDIKEKYGSEILYAETQSQAWQHEQKTKFETEVAKIYNLPQWLWDKKIIEYLSEKHTYPELRRKYDAEGNIVKTRTIDRTLSKMDIIQAYIWSKNEILEKRLINQFGEDVLYSMFDEMSLEDVKLAELMMNIAQSFYPLVNKAFINKYGLDLPKVSCYFPSTPERGSEVDLYNEYSSKSLNNSFTKSRAMSETQPMDFHNPVAILYNHIDGVAKFAFMSDSLDKANLRFKNNDLKRVIVNKYGEDAYRTLEQILMNVTYKKEAPVFNGMNKIIDNMVGNWIQANVAVKPIVGLKQLLSANNYAVDMPYMAWQKGFLKALAHPKETIDYMMNIPYIKARYQGNFSNEFLKQQIENSAFAMSKKLKDACTLFIKMGDIGAIMFGGKPYIDYQIKEKGLSEAEAIKQFIISTNRSQQSSAVSSLSNFQVAMTRNPMGKLFIAFKNSPQQYIRMCGDAIVSYKNGDISKTQCAKLLFQFGYLQPFLYALATSGSLLTFLFAGDDDDLLNDLKLSIFNLGSDALPILGDIYKYAINHLVFKNGYTPQTTPLLGDIENEINRISKEDVSLKDYLESIGYMTLHVGLGYNSKAIMNSVSGAGDIFKGDFIQGAMRLFGYTEKRAKHIVGND